MINSFFTGTNFAAFVIHNFFIRNPMREYSISYEKNFLKNFPITFQNEKQNELIRKV